MNIWKRVIAMMLTASLLAGVPIFPQAEAASDVTVYGLKTEDLVNPVGIDNPNPVFSWKMQSSVLGQCQTAYRIVVQNADIVVWDSGKVESDVSVGIVYAGASLTSSTDYTWKVTVWDKDGNTAESPQASFATALLEANAFADTDFISYFGDEAVTEYTLDLDFIVNKGAMGPVFGAKDSGNLVMWQINAGKMQIRPHFREGGSWVAYPDYASSVYPVSAIDISSAFTGLGDLHHLRLVVNGNTVQTWMGADQDSLVLLNTYTHTEPLPLGLVGLRQAVGESGWMDNFVVTAPDGEILYENTFGEANDIRVTDGEVSDGWLKMNGTKDVICLQATETSLPAYRKAVQVGSGLVSAKRYTAGLGVYESYINGVRVGRKQPDGSVVYDELKPGFTQRNKRQYYSSFDVTWMLREGEENVLGGVVSDGWWRGVGSLYLGQETAYLAKLQLTYADGTSQEIHTDTTWKSEKQAAFQLGTGIYAGERYDASVDQSWMLPGFDDSSWHYARKNTEFSGTLDAWNGVPIIVREDLERKPQAMTVYNGATGASDTAYGDVQVLSNPTDGQSISLQAGQTLLVNFGQNFAGWEYFEIEGEKGTVVTVEHGEWLNEAGGVKDRGNDGPGGSIYNANYRTATANTVYTLSGNGIESYHPTHSFYGFQYMEIKATGDITVHKVRGQVVTSVHEDTATMVTSDPKVNQLLSNIRWGMYSNYLSVPTDCPQRNERHGWTGDSQVFSQAGTYLAFAKSFLEKYLQDMRDAQADASVFGGVFDGAYSDIAPYTQNYGSAVDEYGNKTYGEVGWGDAGIIIPWTLYMMYGDTSTILEHWESMRRYMDVFMESTNGDGSYKGAKDHLNLENTSLAPAGKVLAVAYYTWDALMMADMAEAIGDTQAAAHYREAYEREKAIFQERFVKEDGSLTRFEQTAMLYALYLDLLPNEASVERVSEDLIASIEQYGDHMYTGFLGTSIITKTLTKIGRSDVAYTLLLQESYPSWLYSVNEGATTIWERWNTYTAESGFGDVSMNSFNHYSYGAVAGWMYQTMGGIGYDSAAPGFKNVLLAPAFDSRIPQITTSYDSVYGTISTKSTISGENWTYQATVPANSTATVKLPMEGKTLTVNGKSLSALTLETDGIVYMGTADGIAIFEAVAGTFTFAATAGVTQLDWSKPQYCAHCKKDVLWTAYSAAANLTEGHYYLAKDITTTLTNGIGAASSGKMSCFHLNGHSITCTTGNRVFNVAAGRTLNVMDHPENQGKLIRDNSKNNRGGIFNLSDTGIVNVYGGTMMLSEGNTGSYGAVVYLNGTCKFTMHGGVLKNGAVSSSASVKNGGILYAEGSAQVIMNGGLIEGGYAPGNGGNVYLQDSANFTLNGGTVSGGKADGNGGNIYLASGTKLTICEDQGAALIRTGSATQGGNLALVGATVTMHAGTIAHGYATGTASSNGGGNIHMDAGSTFTLSQDAGKQSRITNGRTAATNYGGNIHNYGSFTMYGGKVVRGDANGSGSNLCNRGTVTVSGGYMGDAVKGGNLLTMTGGKTYVTGGTVSGAQQDGTRYQSFRVWDSGKLYVSGGTIVGGPLVADKSAVVQISGGDLSDIAVKYELNSATKGTGTLTISGGEIGNLVLGDDSADYDLCVTLTGTPIIDAITQGDPLVPVMISELTEGASLTFTKPVLDMVFGSGDSTKYLYSDNEYYPVLDGTSLKWAAPESVSVAFTATHTEAQATVTYRGEDYALPATVPVFKGIEAQITATVGNPAEYSILGFVVNGEFIPGTKLTVTADEAMEIQLATKALGYKNLAAGKTGICSSAASGTNEWKLEGLTDGVYNTNGKLRGYSSEGSKTSDMDHWFGVDLGADTAVNRIHLYPRTDKFGTDGKTSSFPANFTVEVCKDGETKYTTVASFQNYVAPYMVPALIEFDQQTVRYVRVRVTSMTNRNAGESYYYVQLAEMGIYNTGLPVQIGDTEYPTLAEAVSAVQDGQYIKLNRDLTEDVRIDKDICLDLCGNVLKGNITGTGTLYAMDSSGDNYTIPTGRIEGSVTCRVAGNIKTNVTGNVKRYLTVADGECYTFHRIYMGITHMSLRPKDVGVGYKALFCGDEMVRSQIQEFGYTLWVGADGERHSYYLTGDDYSNEKVLTLLIRNFFVDSHSETPVNGSVFLKLKDGTLIESSTYSYTLRYLIEQVCKDLSKLTDGEYAALQSFVQTYNAVMKHWELGELHN